jgi:hypothetical protein
MADDMGSGWTAKAPSNDQGSPADACVKTGAGAVDPNVKSMGQEFDNGDLTVSSDASVYASADTVKAQQALYTADATIACIDAALRKELSDVITSAGGTMSGFSLRRVDYPAVRGTGFVYDLRVNATQNGQTVPIESAVMGDSLGRNEVSMQVTAQNGPVPTDLFDQLVTKLQAKLKQAGTS